MADIHQTISLGIGSPSGIKEFLTFGLQIGAAAVPDYIFDGNVAVRITADGDIAMRAIADGNVPVRITADGDVEL